MTVAVPCRSAKAAEPPPLPDDPLRGTRYALGRALARGAMGSVFEAKHRELGTTVVVKLLRAGLVAREDLAARLRVEARALARMSHPNLVAVLDLGTSADGRPFIVLERLSGRTLGDELRRRGCLPPLDAIDLVRQALAGLEAAHRAGIVHRDVKLDNLFLCDAGNNGRRVVKVLDFGVAKILDAGAEIAPRFETEEGVVLGTPAYLAPEQVKAGPVDARTDVYAAAVVLHRLLTGRSLFSHRDPAQLLAAAAFELPAPPSRHAPTALPRELDELVLRALAKDPAERPASARAFSRELGRVARALRSGGRRPRRSLASVAAASSRPGPRGVVPSGWRVPQASTPSEPAGRSLRAAPLFPPDPPSEPDTTTLPLAPPAPAPPIDDDPTERMPVPPVGAPDPPSPARRAAEGSRPVRADPVLPARARLDGESNRTTIDGPPSRQPAPRRSPGLATLLPLFAVAFAAASATATLLLLVRWGLLR